MTTVTEIQKVGNSDSLNIAWWARDARLYKKTPLGTKCRINLLLTQKRYLI